MTPAEIKAARRALRLSQDGFADLLGYQGKHRGEQVRRLEMDPERASARSLPAGAELAIRYMLRDLAEGRWTGEPDV